MDYDNIKLRAMVLEREKMIVIIKGLIENVKAKNEKHGSVYCGGMPLQFAITELRSMGIDI